MQTRIETLEIENQKVMLELNFYSDNDILVLSSIYKKWVQLSDLIQENGGRRINILSYYLKQYSATILKAEDLIKQ